MGQEPPQSSTFPYPTLDWDGFTEHAESTVSSPLSFEESDTEEPTLQHDVDLMMQWVKKNHADDMIQEMGCQIFDPGGLIFGQSLEMTTAEELQTYKERGEALLQEQVVTGNPKDEDLNMELIQDDVREFQTLGLKRLIQERTAKLRWKGADPTTMQEAMRGFMYEGPLTDPLHNGVRPFMRESFTPNGGIGYRQSKSYRDNREACNWHTLNLREEGKAIIIPWDLLSKKEQAQVHINTWILAPAQGKPNGRCCLNGAAKIGKRHSLNSGMDLSKSDEAYPPTRLPTLVDICQMAHEAKGRADAAGEEVVGAVIDVAGAYNQITLSYEAVLHRTVMIYIGLEKTPHICFVLVNNFGDARAGHVYNMAGAFIDFKHNEEFIGRYTRSKTYIDDGVMIDMRSAMEESRAEYRSAVRTPFGPKGIAAKKDVFLGEDLLCLGWHLNLRGKVWRVGPKKRALDKIFAYLYLVLPSNGTDEDAEIRVERRVLHTVASLLSYYSVVLRIGKPFVHSIFKNLGFGRPNQLLVLSKECKRDLSMWKVIVLASMKNPHFMSANIDHLVPAKKGDFILTADASKLVGGGAWLAESVIRANSDGREPIRITEIEEEKAGFSTMGLMYNGMVVSDEASGEISKQGQIRWTKEELTIFSEGFLNERGESIPISINVLEYFVVMHFVLL